MNPDIRPVGRLSWALAIVCLFMAAPAPTSSKAQAAEPKSGGQIISTFKRDGTCVPPESGPGATRETAIKLEWMGELNADKFSSKPRFECRWVTVRGFYRWTRYGDYDGFLFIDGLAAAMREYRVGYHQLTIENFQSPDLRGLQWNGSIVTVTGRYYDLCRPLREQQEVAKAKGDFLYIPGGPCHYGDDMGAMLKDVTIGSVHAGPNLRPRGSANRLVLGDLVELPNDKQPYTEVLEQFLEWWTLLARGESALSAADIRRRGVNDKSVAEYWRSALANDDDETSFLNSSPASPIARFSAESAIDRPFAVFAARGAIERAGKLPEFRTLWGCSCLTNDCSNSWPLLLNDATSFFDEYVCMEAVRTDKGWRWQ